MENAIVTKEKKTIKKSAKRIFSSVAALFTAIYWTMFTAFANNAGAGAGGAAGGFGQSVSINTSADPNADDLMNNIIGILLTITRYVGIALVIYGIYEIVMSFMQNQPEAKTKGIVMALAGVVMIALKSIISGLGILN